MFKEAEALGLPQPEIIEVGMRVNFIIYLAEPIEIKTTVPITAEVESRLKYSFS
jgi:ATP-dependent DNA helicase RecG